MTIKYDIKINTGDYAGKVIHLETTLDELEDYTIADQLIQQGFLKTWCNAHEYEILYRFAQINHNDAKEDLIHDYDCAPGASLQMETGMGKVEKKAKLEALVYLSNLQMVSATDFKKEWLNEPNHSPVLTYPMNPLPTSLIEVTEALKKIKQI
jgi:hypothetical protein